MRFALRGKRRIKKGREILFPFILSHPYAGSIDFRSELSIHRIQRRGFGVSVNLK